MILYSSCRNSSEVSQFLRVAIVSRGLQRKDFANELGVDPSWLSRVLNGSCNITLDSFFKILSGLGIELELRYVDSIDISSYVTPLPKTIDL